MLEPLAPQFSFCTCILFREIASIAVARDDSEVPALPRICFLRTYAVFSCLLQWSVHLVDGLHVRVPASFIIRRYSGCVLLHSLPSQVSSPCFAKRQVFKKRRALTRLQATSPESVHIGKVPFLYPGKTGVGLQSCKGNLAIFATAVPTCHA